MRQGQLGHHRALRVSLAASILGLVVLAGALAPAQARSGKAEQGGAAIASAGFARADLERVVFIDRGRPAGRPAKPAADASATAFRTFGGRPGWANAGSIDYSVSTSGCASDCAGATAQVNAGFDAWEVSGLSFTQQALGDPDPCGGTNSVSWQTIDGAGSTLAFALVCVLRGPAKEIVGFQVVLDADEPWSDSGNAGSFDIRATTTHEAGHVVGLEHVNSPRNARLTMYPFIEIGDIGFRTLGCGDRLGVDAVYGTSLGCAGVPLD